MDFVMLTAGSTSSCFLAAKRFQTASSVATANQASGLISLMVSMFRFGFWVLYAQCCSSNRVTTVECKQQTIIMSMIIVKEEARNMTEIILCWIEIINDSDYTVFVKIIVKIIVSLYCENDFTNIYNTDLLSVSD
ncbi:hypothetical protein Droror1_Dr00012592 [Drosera rotundifolia]